MDVYHRAQQGPRREKPRFRPFRSPTVSSAPKWGQGCSLCRVPIPSGAMETTGSPRFLGNPRACMPCSSTPVGPQCQAIAAPWCCRRSEDHDGPRKRFHFEAQSHGLHAPCVRFAAGVTPVPRNTRFRWSPAFAGRVCPAGFPRKVSVTLSHGVLLTQALPGALSAETPAVSAASAFPRASGAL